MSQHDFNIANQGFPATRADINNAFQAIASNSSGPTAPSTTYANQWWYDTTNDKMYLRNAADSAWIEVAVLDQTNNEWKITTGVVQAKDSDGLALKTDDGTTRLFINDSNGNIGIGTASPSSNVHIDEDNASGAVYGIVQNDGTTNTNTIAGWVIRDGSNIVSGIRRRRDGSSSPTEIGNFSGDGAVQFLQDDQSCLKFNTDGSIVVNEGGLDRDFRVESDAQSHALFVDAGNGGVGINVSNPAGAALDVYGYYNANRTAHFRGLNGQAYDTKVQLGVGSYYNTVVSEILLEAGYGDNGTHRGHFIREEGYNNSVMRFVRLDRNGLNETTVMTLTDNVEVHGSLSKGSGSFRIDHPLPEMNESHYLQHSFVESPQADNIYRGKVDLVAGQATINIDTVAGMTDGTFALLNREIQCFTSNETGWTAVRGSVSGNILTIEAQDNTCTDTISWLVIGERQDQHMYDTSWTDADGKVIVEPTKASLDNQ